MTRLIVPLLLLAMMCLTAAPVSGQRPAPRVPSAMMAETTLKTIRQIFPGFEILDETIRHISRIFERLRLEPHGTVAAKSD